MAMDVSAWILSPDMRDFLQKRPILSVMEKEDVILHAYRPIEEQFTALQRLRDEANGTEQDKIDDMIRLYRFAMQEIRALRPGEVYVVRNLDWPREAPRLLASYAELERYCNLKKSEILGPLGGFYVEKWGFLDKTLQPFLTFHISAINNPYLFSNIKLQV